MKYMLLIHQGDTPTPYSPEEWGRLSEDEQQAVYAAYQAFNETPGVSPGIQMQPPSRPPPCACRTARRRPPTGRSWPSKRHSAATSSSRPTTWTRRSSSRRASRRPAWRCGRGASGRVGARCILPLQPQQVFRDEWGRVLAGLIGFLGDFDLAEEACPGSVRARRRALAPRRDARQPACVARDHGTQLRDRPHAPRSHARGEDPLARTKPPRHWRCSPAGRAPHLARCRG